MFIHKNQLFHNINDQYIICFEIHYKNLLPVDSLRDHSMSISSSSSKSRPRHMAQSQNSPNRIIPPPFASMALNSYFGSWILPTHFSIIGTALRNSLRAILLSSSVSTLAKAAQYSKYCLIATRKNLNSCHST